MNAEFFVAPLAPGFAFGGIAPTLLANLARRYEQEVGIQVKHWAMWVFHNGSAVPVPTQIDSSTMPTVRACLLLKLTLQEVARVEMRAVGEADKFHIRAAIDQLEELHSIGVA